MRNKEAMNVDDGSSSSQIYPDEVVIGIEELSTRTVPINLLGGSVYRFDETRVVKVSASLFQFIKEREVLRLANHVNLINLVGTCQSKALLLPYMANGSLQSHLFANDGDERHGVLSWGNRIKIAIGVAEGLFYLHQVLKKIHLNINDEHVLLDANYDPVITSLGTATNMKFGADGIEEPVSCGDVKGTLGFAAPEMVVDKLVSTKSDIFSFGILLVVLFTGAKAYDPSRPQGQFLLKDAVPSVPDASLGQDYSFEGLVDILKTAIKCLSPNESDRPDIMDISQALIKASICPLVPINLSQIYPDEVVIGIEELSTRTVPINLLGGSVYRFDETRAVKVSASLFQFIKEREVLRLANHVNLINLVGKCQSKALLLPYMANGSLQSHLFANDGGERHGVLSWGNRIKIAIGVAEGLFYLHQVLKKIHLNINDEHVLLDGNYDPVITSLGTATNMKFGADGIEEPVSCGDVKGTLGFAAPEMVVDKLVSTKSDIFSFGILLVVLFTGAKAYDPSRPQGQFLLKDAVPSVPDANLGQDYSFEGLVDILKTAIKCLSPNESDRPDVMDISQALTKASNCPLVPLVQL